MELVDTLPVLKQFVQDQLLNIRLYLNVTEFPSLKISYFPSTVRGIQQARNTFQLSEQSIEKHLSSFPTLSLLVFFVPAPGYEYANEHEVQLLQTRLLSILSCPFYLFNPSFHTHTKGLSYDHAHQEQESQSLDIVCQLFEHPQDVEMLLKLMSAKAQNRGETQVFACDFLSTIEDQLNQPMKTSLSYPFLKALDALHGLLSCTTWQELAWLCDFSGEWQARSSSSSSSSSFSNTLSVFSESLLLFFRTLIDIHQENE